jgi:hypothetical protein
MVLVIFYCHGLGVPFGHHGIDILFDRHGLVFLLIIVVLFSS